jgi:hypothetical protein
MMRWPLYLTINVCLVALVGAGALSLVRQDTAAQAVQAAALDRGLDGLIAAWTAGGTPPAGRVLRLFVTSEPDETWFAPPESRPFWWPLLSRLSRGGAKAEHDRRAAELFGRAAFSDWHGQGLAWASQRTARLRALSSYIAKARAARARIVLVADGRQAPLAWDAVQEAGTQSAAPAEDRILVDKFIAVGAPAPGPPQSPLIRERLSVWHSEGSSVEPAGNQLEFMDSQGRVLRQALSGEAAKEQGAVALLREMIASDDSLTESLIRAGQLPPGYGSVGRAPAAPAAASLPPALTSRPEPRPLPQAPKPAAAEEPQPQRPAESVSESPRKGMQLGPHPTEEDAAHYEKEQVCASCCSTAGGSWKYGSYFGQKMGTVEERQPYWGCCEGSDWPSNWASVPSCSSLGNFGCSDAYSCGGICGGFRCVR